MGLIRKNGIDYAGLSRSADISATTSNTTMNLQALLNNIIDSIAPVEAKNATAAHAVGSFLMFKGRLYKVTVAIAAEDELVPGTNIVETSIAEELSA